MLYISVYSYFNFLIWDQEQVLDMMAFSNSQIQTGFKWCAMFSHHGEGRRQWEVESAKDKEMQKGKRGLGGPVVQVLDLNPSLYSLIDLNKHYFALTFELW